MTIPATIELIKDSSDNSKQLVLAVAVAVIEHGRRTLKRSDIVGKGIRHMRIVVGAPGNGATLKDELKAQLETDDRVSAVVDLSSADITYPQAAFLAAQAVLDGRADRGILVCGTGVGTAIAASKVKGVRAATAHDLVTVRGSIENYDAQILCMGQNVIAPAAAEALVDVWLNLRHDPASSYGPKLEEIDAYEASEVGV